MFGVLRRAGVSSDPIEDSLSPAVSAAALLHSVARKRKDMLRDTMVFVVQVLSSAETTPRQKDGILHLVSTGRVESSPCTPPGLPSGDIPDTLGQISN